MDLNSVPPRETFSVPRDQQPRTTQSTGQKDDFSASMRSEPSTAPEGDGVLATFEAARSDDPERGETSSRKDRDSDVMDELSDREFFSSLIKSRLPMDASLDIAVDPDTQDSVIQVRNKHTGELLRQIPERELAEVLRDGSASPGRLVDTTI